MLGPPFWERSHDKPLHQGGVKVLLYFRGIRGISLLFVPRWWLRAMCSRVFDALLMYSSQSSPAGCLRETSWYANVSSPFPCSEAGTSDVGLRVTESLETDRPSGCLVDALGFISCVALCFVVKSVVHVLVALALPPSVFSRGCLREPFCCVPSVFGRRQSYR